MNWPPTASRVSAPSLLPGAAAGNPDDTPDMPAWDNPDATPDDPDSQPTLAQSPPPHTPSNDNGQPPRRRMPLRIRQRLIQHHRQLRTASARTTAHNRQWATRANAFQSFTLAPVPPACGFGPDHCLFSLGPIIFCRRCGATKSLSQGRSLQRPCRRWAPKGTIGLIRTLLRGKAPNKFYRDLLHSTTLPVKRLRTKTKPTPRLIIPAHLIAPDSPPPPRPVIRIQARTVLRGAAFRLPATATHDVAPSHRTVSPAAHAPDATSTPAGTHRSQSPALTSHTPMSNWPPSPCAFDATPTMDHPAEPIHRYHDGNRHAATTEADAAVPSASFHDAAARRNAKAASLPSSSRATHRAASLGTSLQVPGPSDCVAPAAMAAGTPALIGDSYPPTPTTPTIPWPAMECSEQAAMASSDGLLHPLEGTQGD